MLMRMLMLVLMLMLIVMVMMIMVVMMIQVDDESPVRPGAIGQGLDASGRSGGAEPRGGRQGRPSRGEFVLIFSHQRRCEVPFWS